uniref:Copper resistance D domain-containing protein (YcnJ) n=1 Tax=uncultured marine thaumarchaeote AD1000_21_H05 TaxID=1455901 RepID=A0A075FLU9_9ARCH|nr:copper resistance D domain-containing protein (ycnJ) [uncultured marine thaumarchaeote AD1000_21_H05]
MILVIGIPSAYAHPFLLDSEPSQSANAPIGTTQIITKYSEAVEIDFSELKVFDSDGNQIDNGNTTYYEGENSLVITTPPLEDGVYTVTSKVLSKVDGHLVRAAIIFGVGEAKVDASLLESQEESETTFLPEAAARFPGIVGQTVVLGSAIAAIVIWSTQQKYFGKDNLALINKTYRSKFSKITGIALVSVLVSNFIMIAVQTVRLETSPLDVLGTTFGATWLMRMIITIILLGIWFWMERKSRLTGKKHVPMLIASLALIFTTTLLGHGTATELAAPMILDYVHNLLSSVWIGGVIFLAFVILPTIAKLDWMDKEKIVLAILPRYSGMVTIALGILIITGPTLLWFLESNVTSITNSTYGFLIFAKIFLALIMIGLGAYFQFKVQRPAVKNLGGTIGAGVFGFGEKPPDVSKEGFEPPTIEALASKKMVKPLKASAVTGIILLGVVSLLVNSSLPAGEIQTADAQTATFGFSSTLFSEQAKFDVSVLPVGVGPNTISVIVSTIDGESMSDISGLKIKVSNPQRNISPIEISTTQSSDVITKFEGETTFGFAGTWQLEIEAQRTQAANESVIFDVLVKPTLSEIRTQITEYDFPEGESAPLYPRYDGNNTIWISDAAEPKLWKFTLDDKQFTSYEFFGLTTIFLDIDHNGKIWFTDTPNSKIGNFDPNTEEFEIIEIPSLTALSPHSIPIALKVDLDNNIWIAVVDRDMLLVYSQNSKEFEQFLRLPTSESGPSALLLDDNGDMWFAESLAGKIGVVDSKTFEITEFAPDTPLDEPFALLFDKSGSLWLSEHIGPSISKFDPVLETFERVEVPNPESLPFGMAIDKYDNIWFGQHVTDELGVYDPYNDQLIEVSIPTPESFTQFVTSDDDGNVWFVEQRGQKLGVVSISSVPGQARTVTDGISQSGFNYAEIVSPLIAGGIVVSSLFFVKSVNDKRRIDKMLS